MQPFFVAADADRGVEELAEARFGEQFVARAVGDDAAVAHEDDALDFGQDVAEVMGDEDEAGAFGGEAAQGFAQLALGGEVERVGWLVEEQLPRTVDEGARDEDAALFSGGHFADELIGEMRGFHALEGFTRAVAHFVGDVQIGPEGGRREEAGDDGVEAGGDGGALAGQSAWARPRRSAGAAAVRSQRSRPKMRTCMSGLDDGVDLAGHGEDERGFAAAVGAEDGDVLAGADGEIHVVQDDAIAARDVDVAHFEECRANWCCVAQARVRFSMSALTC